MRYLTDVPSACYITSSNNSNGSLGFRVPPDLPCLPKDLLATVTASANIPEQGPLKRKLSRKPHKTSRAKPTHKAPPPSWRSTRSACLLVSCGCYKDSSCTIAITSAEEKIVLLYATRRKEKKRIVFFVLSVVFLHMAFFFYRSCSLCYRT